LEEKTCSQFVQLNLDQKFLKTSKRMELFILNNKVNLITNQKLKTNGDLKSKGKLKFSSTSDMILLNEEPNLKFKKYTICCQFKVPFETTNTWRTLIRSKTHDHHVLIHHPSQELGVYDNEFGRCFVGCGYKMDCLKKGYHHLAAVGKKDKTVFYIDGKKVGTSDFQSKNEISSVGNNYGCGQPFKTKIYDVRVYDCDLSKEEIAEIAQQDEDKLKPSPKSENLQLWIPLQNKIENILHFEEDEKFKPMDLKISCNLNPSKRGLSFLNPQDNIYILSKNDRNIFQDDYTLSFHFNTPFLDKDNSAEWKTFFRGEKTDHHVIIHKNGELGMYCNNVGFVGCGYNTNDLKKGEHNMIVLSKSEKTEFYIDGEKVGTSGNKSSDRIVAIGNSQGGGQACMTSLWDIRIYSKILNPKEIQKVSMIINDFKYENSCSFESVVDYNKIENKEKEKEKVFFKEFIDNEKFSDLTIKIEEKEIHLHKLIIYKKIPNFFDKYNVNQNIIEITNHSYHSFLNFIKFVYSNQIGLDDFDETMEILKEFGIDYNEILDCIEKMDVKLLNYFSNFNIENQKKILNLLDQNIFEKESFNGLDENLKVLFYSYYYFKII
jgi:hypothetical protein